MRTRVLLFADLDGTFLEPRTYSFETSRQILPRLRAAGIPLIFSTSKTRAEVEPIHEALGIRAPFLVENGGAVFIPRGTFPFEPPNAERRGAYDVIPYGASHRSLVAHLDEIEAETGVPLVCFHRMTAAEIAAETGLALTAAGHAMMREFDAPFRLSDPDLPGRANVEESIRAKGLSCTPGARFLHLHMGCDKGAAARALADVYRKADGKVWTVGIGDSAADLPLLESMDAPAVVRAEDGAVDPELAARLPHALRAKGMGPSGFVEIVKQLLAGRL
jgi:mannosyl-3-phosphoglycerate phosphatase